jgi:membrane-associated protease RseP (regulator of RpoE activity)
VIGMQNVTKDRRKLIDIGAAGPLAGLLVAVPVLIYGLSLSPVMPLHPGMQEGNSILYGLLKVITKGAWLPDQFHDVNLHPTAYAGWAGLMITMINLLPIGQLDGGHVATAYFGNGYNRFARRLHQVMPAIAVLAFAWVMLLVRFETRANGGWSITAAAQIAVFGALPWMIWWGMLTLMKRISGSASHPPVESRPLVQSRRGLFWFMVVVFVLLLMPVPMRFTLAGSEAPTASTVSAPESKSIAVPP